MFSDSATRPNILVKVLVPVSLLYLSLPSLIFSFGWLRWYWAGLCTGLLVLALVESTRMTFQQVTAADSSSDTSSGTSPRLPSRHLIFLFVIALGWLSIAGVGGVGHQHTDWQKHESILADLVNYRWPVIYDLYDLPHPLVYYLAYYLPAALVGKVGGWAGAQVTLFVWTYIGLILSMLWFWLLVHKASAKAAYATFLIFIFFSGLDALGKLIDNGFDLFAVMPNRVERWYDMFEYSANTVLLYWVPNQALTGWISAGIILYAIVCRWPKRISWLPFGLSMLGTPFVTIGLVPYLLIEFLSDQEPLLIRFRRYLTWSNLGGVVFLFFTTLFYASKLYAVSPNIDVGIPHGFAISLDSPQLLRDVGKLVLFWIVEVGIYAFLIRKSVMSEDRIWRWLFVTTLISLTLLPLYQVGLFNDLIMRASIPALFCLGVMVTRALYRNAMGHWARIALVVALSIGAVTAVDDALSSMAAIYRESTGMPNSEIPDETRGIVEIYRSRPQYFMQYVGSYESPFFQYVAKEQE